MLVIVKSSKYSDDMKPQLISGIMSVSRWVSNLQNWELRKRTFARGVVIRAAKWEGVFWTPFSSTSKSCIHFSHRQSY